MAKKKIAPRSGSETADLWERFSDVPEWRSRYDKYRASGMSYARSVEAASRAATSKGAGGAAGTIAPTGKARPPKRAGDKPVVAGGGEKGQGIVKRNDMKGATRKAKTRDQGEFIVKKAWKAATAASGETWKTLTPRQKVQLVLKGIPSKINGEVAIGIVRGLTTRATGTRGGSDAAAEIATWAKDKGVTSPAGEITVAKTASREGRKMRSRRGGKGSTGVQKPMGKDVKNAVADVVVTRTGDTVRRLKSQVENLTQDIGWREGESDPAVQKRVKEIMDADTSGKSRKKKYNRALAAVLREAKPDKGVNTPKTPAFSRYRTIAIPVKKTYTGSEDPRTGSIRSLTRETTKKIRVPMVGDKIAVYNERAARWDLLTVKEFRERAASSDIPEAKDSSGKPPKPAKREFKGKMDLLSKVGEVGNKEFTEASLTDAYMQIREKFIAKNKEAKAKLVAEGASPEKIKEFMRGRGAPSVREVAESLGFEPSTKEEFGLIRRVSRTIKREGRRKEVLRREASKPRKIKGSTRKVLPDTTEKQREAFIKAEDTRVRKREIPKAAPAERTKVLTKSQSDAIGKAVVKGEAVPESAIPAPKEVARIRRVNRLKEDAVPKKIAEKPYSIRDAALQHLVDPKDRKAFRMIEDLNRKGYSKTQVRDLLSGNRKITPAARKVAKGLGMINIATLALSLLDNLDNKKKK